MTRCQLNKLPSYEERMNRPETILTNMTVEITNAQNALSILNQPRKTEEELFAREFKDTEYFYRNRHPQFINEIEDVVFQQNLTPKEACESVARSHIPALLEKQNNKYDAAQKTVNACAANCRVQLDRLKSNGTLVYKGTPTEQQVFSMAKQVCACKVALEDVSLESFGAHIVMDCKGMKVEVFF